MATINTNKLLTDEIDSLQKLADGLTQREAVIPTILIAGTTWKTPDVVSRIQAHIVLAKAVPATRAAWQNAIAAEKADSVAFKPIVAGVHQVLLTAFGGQVDVLASFGLAPRKKPVVPPAVRTAAAIKAKATRAARGTKGTVQKAAITTQVMVAPAAATEVKVDGAGANPVVVTGAPVTAAAAPSAAAAPAAGVSAAGNAASAPAGAPGLTPVPAVHSIP